MIDVNQYLDSRNRDLWEELNHAFNISLDYSSDDFYGNYLKKNDCIIFVPIGEDCDSASFAHELLHLYLPQREIRIGCYLECLLREIYSLNIIFDKPLYDHISNCLEHIKMLPIYLKMGYPIEKFLSDYYEEKLTIVGLKMLSRRYKKGIFSHKFNHVAVNYYIAKFFAAKSDINPTHNYDKLLCYMKQLDSSLYLALDTFWKGWVDYDVEKKREVWEDNYRTLVGSLADDLNDWSNNKKIV